MKVAFFYISIFCMTTSNLFSQTNEDCIRLSQDILYAVRTGDSTVTYAEALAGISFEQIMLQLDNEDKKKAFWLNIYNAYTQTGLLENPAWYQNRNKFYIRKFIVVAGKNLSLDFIEHGIIRKSKIKLSLGYLNKLFPGRLEKKLRLKKLDYRIHFALNCGAKSCPSIAFYKPDQVNKQLDIATNAYLKTEVIFNKENNSVELPAIFSWFRGDFGGKKGIIKKLQQRDIIPANISPSFKWKKYDWTLALKNYESS